MKDVKVNDSHTTTAPGDTKSRPRQAYTSPQLRVYGPVSRLTMGATGTGPDGVMMTMSPGMGSDRSIKENIVRVGTHPLGIGLYLFDYKPEFRDANRHDRQLGVMADEVETILPEAVTVHPDGYKMVDYAILARAQASLTVH
jgi:hypothetical protein